MWGRGLYAILAEVAIFDTKDDVGSFGGGDDVRERGMRRNSIVSCGAVMSVAVCDGQIPS